MKRIIAFVIAAMMLFALCACGEESDSENGEKQAETAITKDYDKLCFVSGEVCFGIGDEVEGIVDALGKPDGTFESESCAFQGKDYYYYYDSIGFEIMANDFDGTQLITGITVADDTVSNPQGVKIGMDIDEAIALMDMEYTQSGSVYSVVEGSTTLRIRAGDDNCVAAIEYCAEVSE